MDRILHLDIYVVLAHGDVVKAGELLFAEPNWQGLRNSAFRYDEEWLGYPQRYDLDPRHLPLGRNSTPSHNLTGPLSVFSDSLPDDWGRRLLVAEAGLKGQRWTEADLLKALGSGGLGSLCYVPHGSPRPSPEDRSASVLDKARRHFSAGHKRKPGARLDVPL